MYALVIAFFSEENKYKIHFFPLFLFFPFLRGGKGGALSRATDCATCNLSDVAVAREGRSPERPIAQRAIYLQLKQRAHLNTDLTCGDTRRRGRTGVRPSRPYTNTQKNPSGVCRRDFEFALSFRL